jgi:hypothetical protein
MRNFKNKLSISIIIMAIAYCESTMFGNTTDNLIGIHEILKRAEESLYINGVTKTINEELMLRDP